MSIALFDLLYGIFTILLLGIAPPTPKLRNSVTPNTFGSRHLSYQNQNPGTISQCALTCTLPYAYLRGTL